MSSVDRNLTRVSITLSALLNFLLFCATRTFVYYDNLLMLPSIGYAMWIPIALLHIVFMGSVCQKENLRDLVTEKVLQLYVLRLIMICWLTYACFSARFAIASFLSIGILSTSILILHCIANEFRKRLTSFTLYEYACTEVPLALSMGAETILALSVVNAFVVQISEQYAQKPAAVQLASFIVSLGLLLQASVMYSGIPQIMNPFSQIPILWALVSLTFRWYNDKSELAQAISYSTAGATIIVLIFTIVSFYITFKIDFFKSLTSETLAVNTRNQTQRLNAL